MTEEQIQAALQRIHELTQLNAPESAGAAWDDLLATVVAYARVFPGKGATEVVARALRASDMLTKDEEALMAHV